MSARSSEDVRFTVVQSREGLFGVLDLDEARVCPFSGETAEDVAQGVAQALQEGKLELIKEFGWLSANSFFGAELE